MTELASRSREPAGDGRGQRLLEHIELGCAVGELPERRVILPIFCGAGGGRTLDRMRGERSGRDRVDEGAELDAERPAPGKVTSTQRLGGPGQPTYRVAPGKRTLTMSLPAGPAHQSGRG